MLLPELPLELPPIEEPPDDVPELPELPPIDDPPDDDPPVELPWLPELPPIDVPPVELPEVPLGDVPGVPGVLDEPDPGVPDVPPVLPLVPPDVPPPAGGGVVLELVPESVAPGDAPGVDLLVEELVPPCSELVVPLLLPPRLQAARLTVSNPRRISIFEVPRLDLITIPFKSGCADYWLDWSMLHKFQRLSSGSAPQQTLEQTLKQDLTLSERQVWERQHVRSR